MARKKQSIVHKVIRFVKEKPIVALALIALVAGSVGMLSASAAYGDCDTNAIIRCGAFPDSGGDASFDLMKSRMSQEQYNIYSTVVGQAVSPSNFNSSDFVLGVLDSNNTVRVNGSVVASGTYTVGRHNTSASTKIDINGGADTDIYKRPASSNFGSGTSALNVWVKMSGGRFQYAVIRACGNPVFITPTGSPSVSIKKYVGSVSNPAGYHDANTTPITVGAGDTITYKIDVTNSGSAAQQGVYISDQVENLIGGAVDISTVRITGANVPRARIEPVSGKKWVKSDAFTINPGESKYIEFSAKVKSSYSGTFDNLACAGLTSGGLPICDNAKVTVPARPTPPPAPTPTYSCTNLTKEDISRTRFKFTVSGTASGGASITGYIFKVNGVEVQNSTSRTYTRTQTTPGTYTVTAFVKTNKGTTGQVAACTKTYTVTPPPAPRVPEYDIIKYVNGDDAQDNNHAVTVDPNGEFEYKVEVNNTGDVKINTIKVWDVLPQGVTYVDDTLKLNNQAVANDNDYFDPSRGINVTNLEAGATATLTFKAKIVAESDEDKAEMCANGDGTFYNNIAYANPAPQDGTDLPENHDPAVVVCTYTPPVDHPSVDIQKDVSQYDVAVGEEFDWILTVKNNGDIDLNNVRVTDTAPANTEFISTEQVEGAPSTLEDGQFTATIASLEVGESVRFVIKAKLTAYQDGEITNTACVDAPEVNPGDLNSSDDCDDAKVKPEIEKCTVPGKEDMPANSPDCSEPCKIPGKENLKSTDENCDKTGSYTPPTTETPSTGSGGLAVLATLVALVSGVAYYQVYKSSKRSAAKK